MIFNVSEVCFIENSWKENGSPQADRQYTKRKKCTKYKYHCQQLQFKCIQNSNAYDACPIINYKYFFNTFDVTVLEAKQ